MMMRSRRYERRRFPKGSGGSKGRHRRIRTYLSPRGKLEDKIEELLDALAKAAADEAMAYYMDEFEKAVEEMRGQESRLDAISKRLDFLTQELRRPPRPPGPLWKGRKKRK